MKPRKKNESAEAYIARLEQANAELQRQNKAVGKLANKVARAVTWLSVDASVAFQVMAEKAKVRSHPSVIAAVKAFDTIAHPQWAEDGAKIGDLSFPTNWDLDPPDAWAGDADMELNSGIMAAIEYLESRLHRKIGKPEFTEIAEIQAKLAGPLMGLVSGLLPKTREFKAAELPENATKEQLVTLVNDMAFEAMELAEDMRSTNEYLRRDLRAGAYMSIANRLFELSQCVAKVDRTSGELPF